MAEKAGFEGEGEVDFRSPGEVRDARDEGFQETCRTCQDSNKTPQTGCEVTTKSTFSRLASRSYWGLLMLFLTMHHGSIYLFACTCGFRAVSSALRAFYLSKSIRWRLCSCLDIIISHGRQFALASSFGNFRHCAPN
jgi:hypothetical protein